MSKAKKAASGEIKLPKIIDRIPRFDRSIKQPLKGKHVSTSAAIKLYAQTSAGQTMSDMREFADSTNLLFRRTLQQIPKSKDYAYTQLDRAWDASCNYMNAANNYAGQMAGIAYQWIPFGKKPTNGYSTVPLLEDDEFDVEIGSPDDDSLDADLLLLKGGNTDIELDIVTKPVEEQKLPEVEVEGEKKKEKKEKKEKSEDKAEKEGKEKSEKVKEGKKIKEAKEGEEIKDTTEVEEGKEGKKSKEEKKAKKLKKVKEGKADDDGDDDEDAVQRSILKSWGLTFLSMGKQVANFLKIIRAVTRGTPKSGSLSAKSVSYSAPNSAFSWGSDIIITGVLFASKVKKFNKVFEMIYYRTIFIQGQSRKYLKIVQKLEMLKLHEKQIAMYLKVEELEQKAKTTALSDSEQTELKEAREFGSEKNINQEINRIWNLLRRDKSKFKGFDWEKMKDPSTGIIDPKTGKVDPKTVQMDHKAVNKAQKKLLEKIEKIEAQKPGLEKWNEISKGKYPFSDFLYKLTKTAVDLLKITRVVAFTFTKGTKSVGLKVLNSAVKDIYMCVSLPLTIWSIVLGQKEVRERYNLKADVTELMKTRFKEEDPELWAILKNISHNQDVKQTALDLGLDVAGLLTLTGSLMLITLPSVLPASVTAAIAAFGVGGLTLGAISATIPILPFLITLAPTLVLLSAVTIMIIDYGMTLYQTGNDFKHSVHCGALEAMLEKSDHILEQFKNGTFNPIETENSDPKIFQQNVDELSLINELLELDLNINDSNLEDRLKEVREYCIRKLMKEKSDWATFRLIHRLYTENEAVKTVEGDSANSATGSKKPFMSVRELIRRWDLYTEEEINLIAVEEGMANAALLKEFGKLFRDEIHLPKQEDEETKTVHGR